VATMPIDLPPEKRLLAWLEAAIDLAPRLRITRIRLARAVLWLSGRAPRSWMVSTQYSAHQSGGASGADIRAAKVSNE
jgi:hypothetical protein